MSMFGLSYDDIYKWAKAGGLSHADADFCARVGLLPVNPRPPESDKFYRLFWQASTSER